MIVTMCNSVLSCEQRISRVRVLTSLQIVLVLHSLFVVLLCGFVVVHPHPAQIAPTLKIFWIEQLNNRGSNQVL